METTKSTFDEVTFSNHMEVPGRLIILFKQAGLYGERKQDLWKPTGSAAKHLC